MIVSVTKYWWFYFIVYLFFYHVERFLYPRRSGISLKNTLSLGMEISPPCARSFKCISKFWFLLGALNCSMEIQNKYFGANFLSLDQYILGDYFQEYLLVILCFSFLLVAFREIMYFNISIIWCFCSNSDAYFSFVAFFTAHNNMTCWAFCEWRTFVILNPDVILFVLIN